MAEWLRIPLSSALLKGLYWRVDISKLQNNTVESEPIYLVDGGASFGEMERVIAISVMGVKTGGGSVFLPDLKAGSKAERLVEFKKSWLEWLRESFQADLAETFVNVYMAAAAMCIRRIADLDRSLDQYLSEEESDRSRMAGACFMVGKNEMQRAPQWQKYIKCVEQEKCPGHVLTLFALQAALYHLPLLSALTAYVYFEWRAGMGIVMGENDLPGKELSLQWFQQEYPESMQVVRQVFDGGSEFGQAISAL